MTVQCPPDSGIANLQAAMLFSLGEGNVSTRQVCLLVASCSYVVEPPELQLVLPAMLRLASV